MIKIRVDMGNVPNMIVGLLRLDGLKRGMISGAIYLQGRLGEYPDQPSGVTYDRTGNLRNRWTHKPLNGGLTVRLGNNAGYADEVQGHQKNPYFQKVWGDHSIRAVVRREKRQVSAIVQNEVSRVARAG